MGQTFPQEKQSFWMRFLFLFLKNMAQVYYNEYNDNTVSVFIYNNASSALLFIYSISKLYNKHSPVKVPTQCNISDRRVQGQIKMSGSRAYTNFITSASREKANKTVCFTVRIKTVQ